MAALRTVGLAFVAVGGVLAVVSFRADRRLMKGLLRVPAPAAPGAAIETTLVLPASGRYQLVLDFTIGPGGQRNSIFDSSLPVALDAQIAGRVWRSDSAVDATYGGGESAGLRVSTAYGAEGEALRLRVTALPPLEALRAYDPHIELRRHYVEEYRLSGAYATRLFAGLLTLAVGVWLSLRRTGKRPVGRDAATRAR